ncbi:MAG: hypothetical protein ABJM39_03645 [Porticoccus sp.]|uniref:hypothetical protein n=1 Tax=Porticoccus sp. TaxID=2024853 RepID=UPI003299FFEE
MKDINGNSVEITGWTQYVGTPDREISVLEIRIGGTETRIRVNISSDEMIEWCATHSHPITDMRNRDKGAA